MNKKSYEWNFDSEDVNIHAVQFANFNCTSIQAHFNNFVRLVTKTGTSLQYLCSVVRIHLTSNLKEYLVISLLIKLLGTLLYFWCLHQIVVSYVEYSFLIINILNLHIEAVDIEQNHLSFTQKGRNRKNFERSEEVELCKYGNLQTVGGRQIWSRSAFLREENVTSCVTKQQRLITQK